MWSNNSSNFVKRTLKVGIFYRQSRWKSKKEHWAFALRKKKNTDKALEHFDDFYQQVFLQQWPSVRLGLLCQNKYCAIVNNFSDTDRIEKELKDLGAINMKELIEVQSSFKKFKAGKGSLNQKHDRNSKEGSERTNQTSEIVNSLSPSVETPSSHTTESFNGVQVKEEDNNIRSDDERLIEPQDLTNLYNFVPANRLKGLVDYVTETQHYSYYTLEEDESSKKVVQMESEDSLTFPHSLSIYTFDAGNISRFPKPGKGSTGVRDYYLMDGSSVLPVLCLGLQMGDSLLDMCSAPGGKTLLSLQTLLTGKVVSNDLSMSRLTRVKTVLNEFIYDMPTKEEKEQISFSNCDARRLSHLGKFSKILVDVPCTTDRYSLLENDNNIFRPDRVKERLKLPELQAEILTSALKLVEDGGTVVYSTCSLSPVQNDGVVHMALKKIWEETNDNIVIKDLSNALEPYQVLYQFGKNIGLRYGQLVLPYLPSNFGPMYFCKLVKRNKC